MNGQCLAGDSCKFSHDPALLMATMHLNDSTDSLGTAQSFQIQEHGDQFPALLAQTQRSTGANLSPSVAGAFPSTTPLAQARNRGALMPHGTGTRPVSRPNSRHQNRHELSSSISVDDPEAFPTLSALNSKRGSKHHGHRPRHGHGQEKETPSSLADVVKLSPNPSASQKKSDLSKRIRTASGADGAASRRIPEPKHIPWLETGERANQQYLKHRQEAIKHGTVRNKFLQRYDCARLSRDVSALTFSCSAAQAWNRNDARAAKALSLRGQAENEAMRKAHREAAKALYEERNQHLKNGSLAPDDELYIDLHGLHPEEAIEYLDEILMEHSKKSNNHPIIYAITGTGHHSKNGKDKVGKSVRHWLGEEGFLFREFSVPGERGGYIGGVLGVDISSRASRPEASQGDEAASAKIPIVGGKIQVLKREDYER